MLVVVVAPIARRAANRANVGPVALVNIIIVKVVASHFVPKRL
jgi:hypothetical protein